MSAQGAHARGDRVCRVRDARLGLLAGYRGNKPGELAGVATTRDALAYGIAIAACHEVERASQVLHVRARGDERIELGGGRGLAHLAHARRVGTDA